MVVSAGSETRNPGGRRHGSVSTTKRWATERDTPIWLHFIESEYMSLAEVRNRHKGNMYFYIPLPEGVEYDAVLESVVRSLEWLAEGLASSHAA